ncbi:hypothetical protein SUGI_1041950 [Cryptomeria japonica]|uniref:auxin-responsive protein IAA14 n=1 Tax=Cryptomeria japonica TaxID=3369 RepID=UPI002414C429|nr:auxin-responsive protein IAA14 [Cryptomeria japonica]GLJ49299.1 hypothetical protein SUGI_1041950 [Cryptomeria japonica]
MGSFAKDGGDELKETQLTLGLPGVVESHTSPRTAKRPFSQAISDSDHTKWPNLKDEQLNLQPPDKISGSEENSPAPQAEMAPPPKAQVVGWPPIRSFRKNTLTAKSNFKEEGLYVKVSMDGAPYLRKVDLKIYGSYRELSSALEKMFSCFTMGQYGSHGLNESNLMDLLNGSEYVPTYEDKDGDLMLVGDVPWKMFVDSCKRLRIMKGSEAIGLAPRSMEKCKTKM